IRTHNCRLGSLRHPSSISSATAHSCPSKGNGTPRIIVFLRLPRFALYMVRAIAASVDRRVGDCRRRFVDASILSEVTPGGRAPPIRVCFLRRDASAAEGCKEPEQDYHRRKINARHDRTDAQQVSKPNRSPPPSERPEGEQEIREICAHRREQHGGEKTAGAIESGKTRSSLSPTRLNEAIGNASPISASATWIGLRTALLVRVGANIPGDEGTCRR